jgi:hypothetical protein
LTIDSWKIVAILSPGNLSPQFVAWNFISKCTLLRQRFPKLAIFKKLAIFTENGGVLFMSFFHVGQNLNHNHFANHFQQPITIVPYDLF